MRIGGCFHFRRQLGRMWDKKFSCLQLLPRYDAFNRLLTASSNASYGCWYSYDRFGNRISGAAFGTENSCNVAGYGYTNYQITMANSVDLEHRACPIPELGVLSATLSGPFQRSDTRHLQDCRTHHNAAVVAFKRLHPRSHLNPIMAVELYCAVRIPMSSRSQHEYHSSAARR